MFAFRLVSRVLANEKALQKRWRALMSMGTGGPSSKWASSRKALSWVGGASLAAISTRPAYGGLCQRRRSFNPESPVVT